MPHDVLQGAYAILNMLFRFAQPLFPAVQRLQLRTGLRAGALRRPHRPLRRRFILLIHAAHPGVRPFRFLSAPRLGGRRGICPRLLAYPLPTGLFVAGDLLPRAVDFPPRIDNFFPAALQHFSVVVEDKPRPSEVRPHQLEGMVGDLGNHLQIGEEQRADLPEHPAVFPPSLRREYLPDFGKPFRERLSERLYAVHAAIDGASHISSASTRQPSISPRRER